MTTKCSTCKNWQNQLSPPFSLEYCTGCIYFGKSDKYEPTGKPKDYFEIRLKCIETAFNILLQKYPDISSIQTNGVEELANQFFAWIMYKKAGKNEG